MTRFLTLSELIYINGRVLDNDKIATGKQKIRDLNLLESAAARPAASVFGQDAYATLSEKSAVLFHSIARNHPFTDGNKRTATIAAIFMFLVNGRRITWDQTEALEKIVAVAENRASAESLAAWFPLEPTEPMLEPDEVRDSAAIAKIITEQKWLLDELNRR